MTIIKEKVNRTITEEEMLRLIPIEPFKTFRQDSKAINFGMIFGMSFKKFSSATLEISWSEEKVDKFVEDKKLKDRVDHMAEKYPLVDSKLWSYYAVSEFLRNQFFKGYQGLMDRIKRNEAFAKDHGYIRSFHGGIRRVPMLTFCIGEDDRTRVDEDLREISNLINITSNTSIQTDEVVKVMSSVNLWNLEQNNMVVFAPSIGTVHDSVDFWVYKDNALEILAAIKDLFERSEDWQKGIKLTVDITICDLNNPEHYYKHGIPYNKFVKLMKESV